MNSHEYCLLDRGGEVVDVVTTQRSLDSLEEKYPGVTVKPIEQVADSVLERYRYYRERP